jgi:hypothetical protein
MNRRSPGRAAAGPAAALAVAGLLIAGCSSSSPSASSGSGGSQAGTSASSGGSSGGQSSTTATGSTLFPVAVGEKWVYADHLGTLGSSTTVNTIKAVKPVSGGDLVTMTNAAHIAGAPAKPTTMTYMFYSNGSISVPFTELSGGKVTIKSGSIVWPPAADLASGQAHTSVLSVSVKTDGQVLNEKVHVTVKGGGTQHVTVPAGSYQASIVDQTMAETIYGHSISFEVRTWLAPGVGPVKSEIVGGTDVPHTVEELKSFTK